MTSKKRRRRGSRTHGGGTHKNRRGAGNRGGRGNAGRKKHHDQTSDPLGKHGFTRPPELQDDVGEVDLQELDEDIALLLEDDLAEETDGGYRVDAREVSATARDAAVVKVLGTRQVRHPLTVVADAFSEAAVEAIESAGGEAIIADEE